MVPRIKPFAFILFILFFLLIYSFSGSVKYIRHAVHPPNLLREDIIPMTMRKLVAVPVDAMLDYDKPGPNPKNDHGKGKPPGGVK